MDFEDFVLFCIEKELKENKNNLRIETSGKDSARVLLNNQNKLWGAKYFDFIIRDMKGEIKYNMDLKADFYNNIKKGFAIRESKYNNTKKYVDSYCNIITLHINLNIKNKVIQFISCKNLEDFEVKNTGGYKQYFIENNKIIFNNKKEIKVTDDLIRQFLNQNKL